MKKLFLEDVDDLDLTIVKSKFTLVTSKDDCDTVLTVLKKPLMLHNTHKPVVGIFKKDNLREFCLSNLISSYKSGLLRLVVIDTNDLDLFKRFGIKVYTEMCDAINEPDHSHIISGETLMHYLIANQRYEIINEQAFKIDLVNKTTVYFVQTDHVKTFLTTQCPSNPFILVTHNSDVMIDTSYEELLNNIPNLIMWYAENVCCVHDKLKCLPIGIANSSWPHGDKCTLIDVALQKIRKKRDVYLGCDTKTNPKERSPLKILCKYYPWQSQKLSYRQYLEHLASFRFAVCPAGVGVDTHRFWECLYLDVIPLVKKSVWSNLWKGKVPFVEVDNWLTITPSFLKKQYVDWLQYSKQWLDVRYYADTILEKAYNIQYNPQVSYLHHVVISTTAEHANVQQLLTDAKHTGWHLDVVISQDTRIGHNFGFGLKVKLLRDYLEKLCENDIVLFTDAFDVRVLGNSKEVYARFKDFNTRILFSAEKNCWPDQFLQSHYYTYLDTSTSYKYLNSGAFMGYVKALKLLIDNAQTKIDIDIDDQLFYTKEYLLHQDDRSFIQLDTCCKIFQSLFMAHNDISPLSLQNKITSSYPLVWHGNGGNKEGDAFYNQIVCCMRVDKDFVCKH